LSAGCLTKFSAALLLDRQGVGSPGGARLPLGGLVDDLRGGIEWPRPLTAAGWSPSAAVHRWQCSRLVVLWSSALPLRMGLDLSTVAGFPGARGVDMNVDDAGPDVSVLVLAYNHGPYIAQCLKGIQRQQFAGSMEILVGEDCSTDDTRAQVADVALKDPRLRIVTAPTNVGMHANLERLIRAARGRYIAFCEGDDYWDDPTKLAAQVALLDADESAGACHTDFDHIMRIGGRWRRRTGVARAVRRVVGQVRYDDLLVQNLVQTCTLVVRTQAAKEYVASPFGQERFAVADWPLCLFVARTAGPIAFLPRSTAVYRHVLGSATNTDWKTNAQRLDDQHRLIDTALAYLGGDEARAAQGHRRTDEALAWNAYLAGDPSLARGAIERSRPANPTSAFVSLMRRVKGTRLGFLLNTIVIRLFARLAERHRYR
jgi:GT2 family glycosyltransferase